VIEHSACAAERASWRYVLETLLVAEFLRHCSADSLWRAEGAPRTPHSRSGTPERGSGAAFGGGLMALRISPDLRKRGLTNTTGAGTVLANDWYDLLALVA